MVAPHLDEFFREAFAAPRVSHSYLCKGLLLSLMHSLPCPLSFASTRAELRVVLVGVCSASTWARFLFKHSTMRARPHPRPWKVASISPSSKKKNDMKDTFGGISALLGRMRWQVISSSMLENEKRDNASSWCSPGSREQLKGVRERERGAA